MGGELNALEWVNTVQEWIILERLKDLAKRLPHPLLLRLFHAHRLRTALPHMRRRAAAAEVPIASAAEVLALKRSDTLVILGGGASINAIPETFWREVGRCDTAGTTFWLAHPFVPRFYFWETIPQCASAAMFDAWWRLAAERAQDYTAAAKFLTEIENADAPGPYPLPDPWRGQVRTVCTVPVPVRSTSELARGLRYLRGRGVFDPGSEVFFKQLSSLSFLLGFAAKLRYRRVLLCGIDLRSSAYFYQDPLRYPRWHALQFADPAKPHITTQPLEWRLPIQDVVLTMQRALLAPLGIELYLQSAASALYPNVPLMPGDFFSR